MKEHLFTVQDIERIKVLQALVARQINNQQAAKRLGLSVRQIIRIKQAYLAEGDQAVIHKLKGKPSVRGYSDELKKKIISLYKDEYNGWNFSHFNDTLEDDYSIKVSDRFVYNLLTTAGYKSPKAKKHKPKKHPPRERKENAGELLQTDASIHLWIVLGKGKDTHKYALHGMIDDATGIVTALRLCNEETNIGYQLCLADTIRRYGIPACLYTDYRTVFQTNKRLTIEEELAGKELEATRFANMCAQLGIGIISTTVPQAKGRIERLWATLQDRLAKELKQHYITTKKEANEYINGVFLPRYNTRFASKIDYNRNYFVKVGADFDYNKKLALPIKRKALHGCYLKLNSRVYCIKDLDGKNVSLPNHTELTVYTCLDGSSYVKDEATEYKLVLVNDLPKRTAIVKPRLAPEKLAEIRANNGRTSKSPWHHYTAYS